jgi:uncharacterized protein YehS (DUF1456 family)
MTNNDVIRSLRYAIDASDLRMIEIFKLAGYPIEEDALRAIMRKEDEKSYIPCTDQVLRLFLDGLIIYRRGKRETPEPAVKKQPGGAMDNNEILKKLRIAFELKGEDLFDLLKSVDFGLSMSEINALFRKKGHKNYVKCGDQLLRNFLKALAVNAKRFQK